MRKEDSQDYNFEQQRKEVGLGEDDHKNKAKKTGKSYSADPPNPATFFEQYNHTLEKNREIEWLNGERDSPDLKAKKPTPQKKQLQLPPFWKPQGNNQQCLPSVIQPTGVKHEVTSLVTATPNPRIELPKQNSGLQVGLKMFNAIIGQNGQTPVASTPKKEPVTASGNKKKGDGDESSNSTPRFNEAISDKQINHQPINLGASKGLAGSTISGPNPLSRLDSSKQVPKDNTGQINVANLNNPVNTFMGSSAGTNNVFTNQPNVAGLNKSGFLAEATKVTNQNLNSFSMMRTVKLSQKREGSAEVTKNAGYRRLVERCIKYREKIRLMLKSSGGTRQKLIDIVTLMTIDHPKPCDRELIISKCDYVASLHEQIEQSKMKGRRLDNHVKIEEHIDDTCFAGFNINRYLAHCEDFIVKKMAQIPQDKMNQIKSLPHIQRLYSKVEHMSCKQFVQKFSTMIENIKVKMVAQIEKCILLLNSKRQAEALALRCTQQVEKLRNRKKALQQQLLKIQQKQQYCRQFFARCYKHLQVESPRQLPKQQINYHFDSLKELRRFAKKLKGQLKEMKKQLKITSEGEPHKAITSHFCSFSNTLAKFLQQLQCIDGPA